MSSSQAGGWAGLAWAAAGLVGLYAMTLGVACSAQRKLLFPAPQPPREPDAALGETLRLSGPGGRPVFAFWARAGAPQSPVVVHFHGNGEQLADVAPLAAALRSRGVSVLAVEYPGYGLASAQSPSEEGLYLSAEVALAHLRDRLGVPPERTTLQGQSLGTGVATEMARRGFGARLALISPYTSIPDVAARLIPVLPVRRVVVDRFASLEKAPSIRLPVLIVHGTHDELIPVCMGQQLRDAFPGARLIEVQGAHHNDLFAPPHGANTLDALADFARSGG